MPSKKRKRPFLRPLAAGLLGAAVLIAAALMLVVVYQKPPAALAPEKEAAREAEPARESAPEPAPVRGLIYVVIDDAGHELDQIRPFLRFPGALTIAVLPGLRHSREVARLAAAAGKSVILHQPMQAVSGLEPGPGAIGEEMSEAELIGVLEKNLAEVPGAVGMNNHMGSKSTADERIMRIVLGFAGRKGLVFVDSRTAADSAAARLAAESGTAFLERQVFLDNDRSRAGIEKEIERGREIAERSGAAVLIGHVWSVELAEVLAEAYARLSVLGYSFEDLGGFMGRRGKNAGARN